MEMLSTRRANPLQAGQDCGPFTENLRRVLRTELFRDPCTAATVASLFSMSRRTLHRRLQAEGHTFRQVLNEVHFEIACELLAHADMSLADVAAALHYCDHSAFTYAFRGWSGQTPSAWRSRHRLLTR
jgi:AraC-like DNA-binding protein